MEPNNIEHQIKEKLIAREIQPSAQAWDRLDAMLAVAEEKKKSGFPYWIIGMAASLLVLLSVGFFFFNQENNGLILNNEVVVSPEDQIPVSNDKQPIVFENTVESTGDDKQQSNTSNQSSTGNNPIVSIANQKKHQKTEGNKDKKAEFLSNSNVAVRQSQKSASTRPSVLQTKPEAVQEKSTYVDAIIVDANALLASAEKIRAVHALAESDRVRVDVNSLLLQVDGEIELTFREKVIHSVSKNFKELKSALANRNQE
jgi:hypothetical protein